LFSVKPELWRGADLMKSILFAPAIVGPDEDTGLLSGVATESGALPPELSLNEETGLLSGIPTEAGEFSFYIVATGDSPMVWTIFNGVLPPGLNLHASAGTISGTPTTSGRFTFTLRVANVPGAHMRTFTISVYTPQERPPIE